MNILKIIIIISVFNMGVSSSFVSWFFSCFSGRKKDKDKNKNLIQKPKVKLTKNHEVLANKYKIDTLIEC